MFCYIIVKCSNFCLIIEMVGSTGTDVEKGFDIIGCNALPFPKSDRFDLVQKALSVPNVIWGMP